MASELSDEFSSALSFIKGGAGGSKKIPQAAQLEFYGLFKQISEGPNKTPQPGRLKVIERAKWTAWQKCEKLSKDEAMKAYITALSKLEPDWKKKTGDNGKIRSKL